MALENTERLYLERQVTLARAVIAALSLLALLETSAAPVSRLSIVVLSSYLAVALVVALAERFLSEARLRIPLVADLVVLGTFLYLTPSVSAFWFLFLFTVFALATRGNIRALLVLVGVATVAIIVRVALEEPFRWQSIGHWVVIGIGTLVSGLGMGFVGAREQQHIARQQFLERITGLLQFERGLNESIRKVLGELALVFKCEQACLAIRDDELERLFIWKVRSDTAEPGGPEALSLSRSDVFLLDSLEVSMVWNRGNGGRGRGFGWDRRTGARFRNVAPPPESTWNELDAQSLMAVTIEANGRPTGRVLLANPLDSRSRFSAGDLRWLEQIIRHIAPPLENIFLLRSLRARAIESERSRISRDLHDGILQTLLSLKIQLDVLRRKLPDRPEQACLELASLQKTVHQESEELRRMVTDLRPLRVESADMRELMHGFAERFRSEHGLAVDLFIESHGVSRDFRVPGRRQV